MKVVYVNEFGPKIIDIDNSLETYQKGVGGYIEIFQIAEDVVIICNENGLLEKLPLRLLVVDENDEVITGIVGDFFIVGAKPDDEDFSELPEEKLLEYAKACARHKIQYKRC